MSSPYDEEFGDWLSDKYLSENPHHKSFYDSIVQLGSADRDKAYYQIAIQNIKKYPEKYFRNWLANVTRFFLDFPYTYKEIFLKTYFNLIPNMFVAVSIIISLLLTILYHKQTPEELILLFLFFLSYFFGSSLISSFQRSFYITMPIWPIIFNFIFNNIIDIRLTNHTKY
jgi:hypothetical protein